MPTLQRLFLALLRPSRRQDADAAKIIEKGLVSPSSVAPAQVQRPWILVGHSMGGRVAMEVAAISAKEAPDRLAAVVVEDMDAVPRASWAPTGDAPTGFERRLPSLDAVREALGMSFSPRG